MAARSGHTRPAVERLRAIASLLRVAKRFTVPELAAHFEVTERTIDRDLEFMRDRLGWEIEFEPRGRRFVLVSAPTPVL